MQILFYGLLCFRKIIFALQNLFLSKIAQNRKKFFTDRQFFFTDRQKNLTRYIVYIYLYYYRGHFSQKKTLLICLIKIIILLLQLSSNY